MGIELGSVDERIVACARSIAYTALSGLPDMAMLAFDRDYRILLAEGEAFARHGYDTRRMVGLTIEDTLPPGLFEHLRPHYAKALAGETVSFEFEAFDGTARFWVSARPLADADGEVIGALVVSRDLSAQLQVGPRARDVELAQTRNPFGRIQRLRQALEEDRFALYAQPIVDLRTGEVVQRELLLRMYADGDASHVVLPGEFLPIAEEFGFIGQIDRWVVDRALEIAAGRPGVELNLSAQSVCDPEIIAHIRSAFRRTGADPAAVVFEITETALIADKEAARRFVREVRELGCKVALDDFGTGYAGFDYLKQLPIDFLKIDLEFVHDLLENQASRHVVQAVVSLARNFGLRTVAEGVENAQTLPLLRHYGVDCAQGFHLGRPAPLALAPESAGR